jgi:SOS-response transcriptional repressor LexA
MKYIDYRIIAVIKQHRLDHGISPTVREIAAALGGRSTSTVQASIRRMTRDGLVTRGRHKACRTLQVVEV